MSVISLAVDIAKRFEGYAKELPDGSCAAYKCPAGVWTIGYGSTHGVKEGDIWTKKQAEDALIDEMQKAYSSLVSYSPSLVSASDKKSAALSDFVYNLGIGNYKKSTLKKCVDVKDWDGCARELRKWVYGGGVILPGLVKRREAEIAFILEG